MNYNDPGNRVTEINVVARSSLIPHMHDVAFDLIRCDKLLCKAPGAVVLPPTPAVYVRLRTIDDIVSHSVSKALDHLHLAHNLMKRWKEKRSELASPALYDA